MAKEKVTEKTLDDMAFKVFQWFGTCGDQLELKFKDLYEILARTGELVQKAEQGMKEVRK